MNYFISKTLNIKDENIHFEEKVEKSKFKGRLSLFYYGELSYTPSYCECCGEENKNHTVIKAGKKQSRITLPHI
ncbi:hypothetical protein [Staphylococcus canis]|uniref:Transposase n=1 Tax=Staphylococcus canis TaxID=2724942 RepID=A0ABS0T9Y3_9STAP|nr:hypothetical protein [Staphylococcus canis]MBI5975554.1 hypothetical protein [Staphylococcus canis]